MTATIDGTDAEDAARRDALVERLFEATLGAWDVLGVYIGDRLGLYRALTDRASASTSEELAGATGTNERYVREWSEWLPAIPDVDARLRDDPPARVADVACGEGRSTIAIARAYPKVRVEGVDSDEASIAAAETHLRGSGVEDRVVFHRVDAADADLAGQCDRSAWSGRAPLERAR
jgi:SAM-dependent methyltransferase